MSGYPTGHKQQSSYGPPPPAYLAGSYYGSLPGPPPGPPGRPPAYPPSAPPGPPPGPIPSHSSIHNSNHPPGPLPNRAQGYPPQPQKRVHYSPQPTHPTPRMTYGPSPQPDQVLLGFVSENLQDYRAVYGPPGARFDALGNVYIDHGTGHREYVGHYRDSHGRIREPPLYDDDCCKCQ